MIYNLVCLKAQFKFYHQLHLKKRAPFHLFGSLSCKIITLQHLLFTDQLITSFCGSIILCVWNIYILKELVSKDSVMP